MDATKCVELLKDMLVPFIQLTYKTMWILQQDNTSPLTAKYTQDYFMESSTVVMNWTAKSPDLNPMENL